MRMFHTCSSCCNRPKKSAAALKWAVREMETRYKLLSDIGVRDIDSYKQGSKEFSYNTDSDLYPI